MLYHNVRLMGHHLRFIDAIAIGVTSAATWWIGTRYGMWQRVPTFNSLIIYSSTIIIGFIVFSGRLKTYRARRTEGIIQELAELFEVVLYASALACLSSEVLSSGAESSTYVAVLLTNTTALLLSRLLVRAGLRSSRRGGNDYRVWLLVGHNERAFQLAEDVLANGHFGIRIDSIVDLPDKALGRAQQTLRKRPPALPSSIKTITIEDVEAFPEILSSRVIDEVVVTLPIRSYYDEVQRILDICCAAGISVRLIPKTFARGGYRTEVSYVGDIPLVTHFTGPSNYSYLLIKRVIDLVGATIGLALTLPLLPIIALAIKLTSAGPVFFFQTRVGLHGRHFRMVKFRSMFRDAPARQRELKSLNQTDGLAFKIKHDPRITPVGRVLRKFHLDEVPQLWNVLMGDMSLVGPRPLPPNEAMGNEWWQRRRLSMPPGLTCFWQVCGDHEMPFRQWVQMDLSYIDRWSIWLDLKIIASTVPAMVRGKGW